MKKSNITGTSNIYVCYTKDPNWDEDFVKEVKGFERLKYIKKRYEVDERIQPLSPKQMAITRTNPRCLYAKNDPCWGYVQGEGVRSKCINDTCQNIKICNPTYSKKEKALWTMLSEEKNLYGCPEKQRKYYLVDLISDEEKFRYNSDSKDLGREFKAISDEKMVTRKKEKPKGRELVIIGYEDTYFGDADNQLSPIWGYVDDLEDNGQIVVNRYGSKKEYVYENACKADKKLEKKITTKVIEKIDTAKEKNLTKNLELSQEKKHFYEKRIKDVIGISHQLTEITEELIEKLSYGKILNIILSNEAEMGYVSSMLLQANVAHDIELCDGKEKVCLWKAQTQKIKFNSGIILVSSAFIKQGCLSQTEIVWKGLENVTKINELVVTGRDFFDFDGIDNQKRWGCRNLYGATHIAIQLEDFNISSTIEREQEISLIKSDNSYLVLSKMEAKPLGITTNNLWGALQNLKFLDEISELPRLISGLVLAKTNGGFEIKGIGHMKFDEY